MSVCLSVCPQHGVATEGSLSGDVDCANRYLHPPPSYTHIDISSTAVIRQMHLRLAELSPSAKSFFSKGDTSTPLVGWVCIGCDNLCLQVPSDVWHAVPARQQPGSWQTDTRICASFFPAWRSCTDALFCFVSGYVSILRMLFLPRSRRSVRVSTCRRSDGAGGT